VGYVLVIPKKREEDEFMLDTKGPKNTLVKPYCLTRFKVFSEYEMNEGVYKVKQESIKKGPVSTYNPLDADNLFMEISKLDIDNEADLQEFFKRFGLLGASYKNETTMKEGREFVEDYKTRGIIEDLAISCARSIADLKEAIEIWEVVQTGHVPAGKIEEISNDVLQSTRKYHRYSSSEIEKDKRLKRAMNSIGIAPNVFHFYFTLDVKEYHNYDKIDPYIMARRYLQYLINSNFSGVYPAMQDVDGQFVPAIEFATPLDTAWWQFQQAVIGGVEFRRCLNPGCNHSIFPVRDNRQKFCPPPFGKNKSNCENAYNQRNRRALKRNQDRVIQLFEEGKTVEQIAEETGIVSEFIAKLEPKK